MTQCDPPTPPPLKNRGYAPEHSCLHGIFNIRYQGAKIWNGICDDIMLLPLKNFKEKIKSNITASYQYIMNICTCSVCRVCIIQLLFTKSVCILSLLMCALGFVAMHVSFSFLLLILLSDPLIINCCNH